MLALALCAAHPAQAQESATPSPIIVETTVPSSAEQGQAPLDESFDWSARFERIREQRRKALRDTTFELQVRSMGLNRNKYDGSKSEAYAGGGSLRLQTGYFRNLFALGLTGYTSQKISGNKDEDGTNVLAPGQDSYSVLGEAYADFMIRDNAHFYIGRKGFDTPYINTNDVRMTPKTFEAAVLQGDFGVGSAGTLNYGLGFFDKIKEWTSEDFTSMSVDAGATVHRGVWSGGALYKRGGFSAGAINYYSEDVINIAYGDVTQTFTLKDGYPVKLSAQYTDQRDVGSKALQGDEFSAHQIGIKADFSVGPALLTAGYTVASGDTNLRSPWGGHPGYTNVQVEDFNRDGEDASLLKAAYQFKSLRGLSAYGLWVRGSEPNAAGELSRDEYDLNVQWAPPDGMIKGLSVRLRYALVKQDGGSSDDLEDFRLIFNYTMERGS